MAELRDLIISEIKKEVKHELEAENSACPNCGSIEINVEVWESCSILSATIICSDCNQENYLKLENNGLNKIESGLRELKDVLESPDHIY